MLHALPLDIIPLLGLDARHLATLSLVSKALKAWTDAAWNAHGVKMHARHVSTRAWPFLTKLILYGSCADIPNVKFPCVTHLEMHPRVTSSSYVRDTAAIASFLSHGFPRLRSLCIQSQGPKNSTRIDPWYLEVPLDSFTNTGQQIGISAHALHLRIEDSKYWPTLLRHDMISHVETLVATCYTAFDLRAARMLRHLSLTTRMMRHPLHHMRSLPASLRTMKLEVLGSDDGMDWTVPYLEHVTSLESLEVHVEYPYLGFENVVPAVFGARKVCEVMIRSETDFGEAEWLEISELAEDGFEVDDLIENACERSRVREVFTSRCALSSFRKFTTDIKEYIGKPPPECVE